MGQEFGKPSVLIPRPCVPRCFTGYPGKIVRKLLERLQEVCSCGTPQFAGYGLKESSLKNIFVDVMISDQQEISTLFRAFDDDANGLIDGLEVVSVICLSSKMPDTEKAEFIFDCYDALGGNKLTLQETFAMVELLLVGCCKAFPVRPPSCDQCDDFASKLLGLKAQPQFGDGDSFERVITKERFVAAMVGSGKLFLELVSARRAVVKDEAAAEERAAREAEARRVAEREAKAVERAREEAEERELAEQEAAEKEEAERRRRDAARAKREALNKRKQEEEAEAKRLRTEIEDKMRAEQDRAATRIQASRRGQQQRKRVVRLRTEEEEEARLQKRVEEELRQKQLDAKKQRDAELAAKRQEAERKREAAESKKQQQAEAEAQRQRAEAEAAEKARAKAEYEQRKKIAEERGLEMVGDAAEAETHSKAGANGDSGGSEAGGGGGGGGDGGGGEQPILQAMASALDSLDALESPAKDGSGAGGGGAGVVRGVVGVRVVEATVESGGKSGGLGLVLEALESTAEGGGSGRVPAVYVRALKPGADGSPNRLARAVEEGGYGLTAGAALLSVDGVDVSRYTVDAVSALLSSGSSGSEGGGGGGGSGSGSGAVERKLVFQMVGGEGLDSPDETDDASLSKPAEAGVRFDVTVPAGPIGLLLQEREVGDSGGAGVVFVAKVKKPLLAHLVPVGASVVAVNGIDTLSGSLDWCSELMAQASNRPRVLTLEVSSDMLLAGGVRGAARFGVKCPSKTAAAISSPQGPGSPLRAAQLASESGQPPARSPRAAIQDVQNKEVVLKVPVNVGLGLVLEEQEQAPKIYIARFDNLRVKGADGDMVNKRNPLVGVVPVGAYLVQINEEPTTRCSLEEVTRVIQRSGAEGPRRTLKFRF